LEYKNKFEVSYKAVLVAVATALVVGATEWAKLGAGSTGPSGAVQG